MTGLMDSLIHGSNLQKGVLVTIGGMLGVFFVLILFYISIRIMTKLFPDKSEDN